MHILLMFLMGDVGSGKWAVGTLHIGSLPLACPSFCNCSWIIRALHVWIGGTFNSYYTRPKVRWAFWLICVMAHQYGAHRVHGKDQTMIWMEPSNINHFHNWKFYDANIGIGGNWQLQPCNSILWKNMKRFSKLFEIFLVIRRWMPELLEIVLKLK